MMAGAPREGLMPSPSGGGAAETNGRPGASSAMLSFLVFFPLVGALAVALLPRRYDIPPRIVAALTTLVVFIATVVLFVIFDRDGGFQFEQRFDWINESGFDIQYLLAVDGISVVMVL